MSLHLEIVTPSEIAFSGECVTVTAPGLLGEFGVLDGHAQTLAVTVAGVVRLQTASGELQFVVGPGFAEVGPGRLTLLVDLCEPGDAVDKAAAKAEIAAAYGVLKVKSSESEEGLSARRQVDLATARLAV
jgi:F-type H+-transporting ATPase subunit epsilon